MTDGQKFCDLRYQITSYGEVIGKVADSLFRDRVINHKTLVQETTENNPLPRYAEPTLIEEGAEQ